MGNLMVLIKKAVKYSWLLSVSLLALYSSAAYTAEKGSDIYVFGHKSPDTDSISGAISVANLYRMRGYNTIPAAQAKPNPETQFLLDKFKVKAPLLIDKIEGHKFILVDFSDKALAPDDFNPSNLVALIDHHKLGDVTSENPIECFIKPIGCCNTIVKQLYDTYGITIPKDIAGMMLGAILSDTMNFKSPTTTDEDIKAAKELAVIAGVSDLNAFGKELKIAKASLKAPADELLLRDFKNFDINGHKVGVGQLELLDLKDVSKELKADIIREMEKLKTQKNYHTLLMFFTCAENGGSAIIVRSKSREKVLEAFKAPDDDSLTLIEGILSRKRDIVPTLYKVLQKD